MKIVHLLGNRRLSPQPDTEGASGIGRAALEIARAQVGLGHRVTVAAIGARNWRAEWQGVRLLSMTPAPWARVTARGRKLDFTQHLPYMALTSRESFDIVHGHLYSYVRVLRAGGRVVHFHTDPFYTGSKGDGIDLKPQDFQHVTRYSAAQLAPGRFVARELERGFAGRGNVHIVYNGVDAAAFDPESWQIRRALLRREWGLAGDTVVFLFAGAIVPEKGVLHLARAFVRLAAQMPNVCLALAGASSLWGTTLTRDLHSGYEAEVRNALRELHDAQKIVFLGKVAAAEMPAIYAAADVVVIPSVWREPFPLVGLEALASGRPVIASNTGGLSEMIDEQTGVLVTPGDEAELAAAMRILASNPDMRAQQGQAARQRATRYSWQVAAREIDDIYHAILAGRRTR
jgi:glycosyltransferase involved in cell wall biosynthesis